MSLLCCPLLVHDTDQALADAQAAKALGADLVEFRLDPFFTGGQGSAHPHDDVGVEIALASRLVADSPLPCIATCRAGWEGGAYDGPEDARLALVEALAALAAPHALPPRYIDVELSTLARSEEARQRVSLALDHPDDARDLAPALILSIHDFASRPSDLTRRLLSARQNPHARVIKLAYAARSLRDNLEIFDLLASRDRPMIALAMGQFGLMSRLLAPKFGGLLTFASLRPSTTTAPGQPTLHQILNTYRFRSIRPSTRVYGLIGWPVAQSLSPLMHNAGFDHLGVDAVYIPLPIPSDSRSERDEPGAAQAAPPSPDDAYLAFKATLLSLIDHAPLDFSGASVTIPHKQNLVRLAREQGWAVDPLADACDAANTLVIDRPRSGPPRSIRVLNTDAHAARGCLESALGPLAGTSLALVGAGGVARAIAAACPDARLTVYARRPEQARALAATGAPDATPITVADPASIHLAPHHAVINCTPVGMLHGPDPDGSPCDVAAIAARHLSTVFFDTVYNPARTPFLAAAGRAGCRTIPGLSMLTRQAAAQFSAWTNRPAPLDLFERLAASTLATPRAEPLAGAGG